MAGDTDDEILLRTSELLAEHRCMLAEVQHKLTKWTDWSSVDE